VASDEGTGSEIEHQAAIHLAVEVEVEVIESFLSVSELGLFFSSLQQSLATAREFVGDEAGEEIDREAWLRPELDEGGFRARRRFRPGVVVLRHDSTQ
jgi:hypothetical protein